MGSLSSKDCDGVRVRTDSMAGWGVESGEMNEEKMSMDLVLRMKLEF